MTPPPADSSRDRRIEDVSNLLLIHPTARALLRPAIRLGVSANTVSVIGFLLGLGAMAGYVRLDALGACVGLVLSIGWLVADGLDGMIARTTGTSSAAGRVLDGVCDHGVFIVIYCALAGNIGTVAGWTLAVAAGALHAGQSMIYEGERARFHRRLRRLLPPPPSATLPFYDTIAGSFDLGAVELERLLQSSATGPALARAYGAAAVAPMRLMALESANVRVAAIFIACLSGAPTWFWWFEIGPLSAILIAAASWHRLVERRVVERFETRGAPLGRSA